MGIFAERTFIAYARPTRERLAQEVLRERAAAGKTVPGFAYSLTSAVPANVAGVLAGLPPGTPVKLLLPELDLLPHNPDRVSPVYAFTRAVPPISWTATQATSWLRDVAAAQVEAGASAVVTPSLLIEASHGDVELRRMFEWAEVIRDLKLVDSLPVLTGLTLHRTWLSDDRKRETLLNVLTDAYDPAFYLVIQWPGEPNYGQVADQLALAGYREAISVLNDAGREVIASRNGLAGILMSAVGASAFVAGTVPAHVSRDPVIRRRAPGVPSPPRINHYLDTKLLGYVPEARLPALAAFAGPQACGCSYCQQQFAGGAPYDATLGFKHLIGAYAEFAHLLDQAQDGPTHLRRRVSGALDLIAKNPGLGLPPYSAGHLDAWRDVLA